MLQLPPIFTADLGATPAAQSFFSNSAPVWLSILVYTAMPIIAFGVPWILAKRHAGPSGHRRRTAMLVFAVPILFLWLILNSVLAPAHHMGQKPDVGHDTELSVRAPRTVGEILIRGAIGCFGAAFLIWLTGAAAARRAPEKGALTDGGESDSPPSDRI